MFRFNKQKGFGIIEIVVALFIIGIAIIVAVGVMRVFLRTALQNTDEIKATTLMGEGFEIVRHIRNKGWTNIDALAADGTKYYPVLDFSSGSDWILTPTFTYVDGSFARYVIFEDVNRDVNQDIAETGTPDPNTRKVTVYVSWEKDGLTTTRSISGYITNFFD